MNYYILDIARMGGYIVIALDEAQSVDSPS